jgi:hypothetical protein
MLRDRLDTRCVDKHNIRRLDKLHPSPCKNIFNPVDILTGGEPREVNKSNMEL